MYVKRQTTQKLVSYNEQNSDVVEEESEQSQSEYQDQSSSSEEEVFEIDKILDKKKVKGKVLYYVKWLGYSDNYNSWEPRSGLLNDNCQDFIDAFEDQQDQKKVNDKENRDDNQDNDNNDGVYTVNKIEKSKQQKFKYREGTMHERFSYLQQDMDELLKRANQCSDIILNNSKNTNKKQIEFGMTNEKEKFFFFITLTSQPSILSQGPETQLKDYQLLGLNWLISLYESKINGILADDMGLGKTIQVIAHIAYLREFKAIKQHHIIIAPKTTITNWEKEFHKWLPCCNVVKLQATQDERDYTLKKFIWKKNFDVVITTYEGVKMCINYLQRINFKYVIIDEGHKLKNEQSQLSEVVRNLKYQHSILLTGTPLQNNLHELWAQLNFIMPSIFDNQELFNHWFEINKELTKEMTQEEIEIKNNDFIRKFHKILNVFMLRRTKSEVLTFLPPKKETHVYTGLTRIQVLMYQNLLANKAPQGDSVKNKHYNNLLIQLRKLCCHPYLFEGIEGEHELVYDEHIIFQSGKMIVLDQLLEKLKKENHKVLIFSQFTTMLNILEDFCIFRKHNFCRIDGSTSLEDRDQQIESFNEENSDKFIFLLSTRAGGLGINLATADTVIIYDSDFNPQTDIQAIDRAHRLGQKNQVMVYRLITENTVEEKIRERSYVKLKWDNLVIQKKQKFQNGNSKDDQNQEDYKKIINFGANKIFKTKGSTISEEHIEELLKRGEDKTKKDFEEIDELIQKNESLGMALNSINCKDFKTKIFEEDDQAMDEAQAKTLFQMQNDKEIYQIKNIQKVEIKIYEHNLYSDRVQLQELLQRQQNALYYKQLYEAIGAQPTTNIRLKMEGLTEQEKIQMNLIQSTGFPNWTQEEFKKFLQILKENDSNDYEKIQQLVETKSVEEIKEYSKVFWKRKGEFSDQLEMETIVSIQKEIKQSKNIMKQIEWKIKQHKNIEEITFSPQIFNKFTKKVSNWSAEVDKELMLIVKKNGYGKWKEIKQEFKEYLEKIIKIQKEQQQQEQQLQQNSDQGQIKDNNNSQETKQNSSNKIQVNQQEEIEQNDEMQLENQNEELKISGEAAKDCNSNKKINEVFNEIEEELEGENKKNEKKLSKEEKLKYANIRDIQSRVNTILKMIEMEKEQIKFQKTEKKNLKQEKIKQKEATQSISKDTVNIVINVDDISQQELQQKETNNNNQDLNGKSKKQKSKKRKNEAIQEDNLVIQIIDENDINGKQAGSQNINSLQGDKTKKSNKNNNVKQNGEKHKSSLEPAKQKLIKKENKNNNINMIGQNGNQQQSNSNLPQSSFKQTKIEQFFKNAKLNDTSCIEVIDD